MTTSQVQSSVGTSAIIGIPGMPYDKGESMDKVSKIATAAVPFGTWVDFSTEDVAQNPTTTGHVTALPYGGIALRDPTKPTQVGYEAGDLMTVMVRGRCFVLAEETVVVTDTPFVRFGTGGGGSQKGAFRNDADTATCVAAPNAKFYKGGGTTSPPVVQLY